MPKLGDTIIFESSPLRHRVGVLVGNVTETHGDILVFSDGFGWEHGVGPHFPALFLPKVPYGKDCWQWRERDQDIVQEVQSTAPAIAVYYSYD